MATRAAPLSTARLRERLFAGLAIPAHPLALDASRRLDRRRQRALARYYLDAGAGGLAVGVHTTQFAIREAGLFEDVLKIAAETAREGPRSPEAGAIRPVLVAESLREFFIKILPLAWLPCWTSESSLLLV